MTNPLNSYNRCPRRSDLAIQADAGLLFPSPVLDIRTALKKKTSGTMECFVQSPGGQYQRENVGGMERRSKLALLSE